MQELRSSDDQWEYNPGPTYKVLDPSIFKDAIEEIYNQDKKK
jgi:hypothetical protein